MQNIASAIAIGGGTYHSCAVLFGGTVQCWGYNYGGQLGNNPGSLPSSSIPVTVSNIAPVATVVGGEYAHSCARLADNTMKCWGNNVLGQLGDGTTTNSYTPVAVQSLTGVTEITAGEYVSCAILGTTGPVKCWGDNSYGKLGMGSLSPAYSSTPVTVTNIP